MFWGNVNDPQVRKKLKIFHKKGEKCGGVCLKEKQKTVILRTKVFGLAKLSPL